MGKWQKVKSKTIYKNKWISLNVDDVIQPDGKEGEYSVLNTSDTISIVVRNKNNKLNLVNLHRYPIDSYSWEVIKGRMDGDQPLAAAKRELAEEMSYQADKWTLLGTFNPLNGLCGELNTIFLAENLTKVDIDERAEEGIIEVKEFSISEIEKMIRENTIKDSFTIVALYKYKQYLESKND